jgi:oligopeptidase B
MYSKTDIPAPACKKVPKTLSLHGDVRQDDYYWLNERENSEMLAYLTAENQYLDTMMSHLANFREKLFQEIVGRIKQTDMSVPYKDNGYWYYTRFEEGKEHPIYCRKAGSLDAAEEIMLNVNDLAKAYAYYAVANWSVSPDNTWIAYCEDTLSRRIYTVRFKNLKTGETLSENIPGVGGNLAWTSDNRTIFYSVKDETLRPAKILKHRLSSDPGIDKLVFHESDPTFSTFVYRSKSKKYIIIGSEQTLSSEYRVLDASTPDGEFKIVQPRQRDLEYSIAHYGEKFFIRTNLDAQNFRLMETPVGATTKENWREVIPHRSDVLLEGMDIFKDYLVLSERIGGITKIRVKRWDGSKDEYIAFGEESYLASPSVNPEFDTEVLRLSYQSMTTPGSVFDFNMRTRDMKLLKEQEVLGDFDKKNYQSERVFATAADGTKVPISLVYRRDLFRKNGSAPLLLYGYGSYGYSMDPYFSSIRLSLLDRGFVYAIAHVRGGEEMGRQWYEDGKLLKKKNTFTDFVDCGRFLVSEKYADAKNLYAMGGSAGGLLMGAVVNLAPEMWKGIVAAVPFVDVVTTMLDESIPLTTGEFDEWGNPKDSTYYHYMKSYSPYDNVEAKHYPTMLVTTGLHDSQVQYWEPAKWVARLREMKQDKNPLLLYCNMNTGHSGAAGRFERHRETAMEYAFLLDLAGRADVHIEPNQK